MSKSALLDLMNLIALIVLIILTDLIILIALMILTTPTRRPTATGTRTSPRWASWHGAASGHIWLHSYVAIGLWHGTAVYGFMARLLYSYMAMGL